MLQKKRSLQTTPYYCCGGMPGIGGGGHCCGSMSGIGGGSHCCVSMPGIGGGGTPEGVIAVGVRQVLGEGGHCCGSTSLLHINDSHCGFFLVPVNSKVNVHPS